MRRQPVPTTSSSRAATRSRCASGPDPAPVPAARTGRPLLVMLAGGLLTIAVRAESPAERIARGNAEYQAGRYAQALEIYGQVPDAPQQPWWPELLHNRAAAAFKLGRIAEARELWVRAAPLRDAHFEAAAQYNLGNCNYAEALQAWQTGNAPQALELLDKAIRQYVDALRLDPGLTDARANLELAYQLQQQIRQSSTTQPSSRPTQDTRQDRQQQQATTRPDEQSQPDSQPQPQQQDQSGEEHPSATRPSGPQQAQTRPADRPSQTQPGGEDQARPPDEQPPHDEQSRPSPQEHQQPGERPEPPQPPTTQPGTPSPQDQPRPAVELKLTPEQAERLVQLVRDAERLRRQRLARQQAAQQRPVDKDW